MAHCELMTYCGCAWIWVSCHSMCSEQRIREVLCDDFIGWFTRSSSGCQGHLAVFVSSIWVPVALVPSVTSISVYCPCWQLAAAGTAGATNQRGMLTNLARTLADQSEVSSKFFCHICNACLSSKASLVTHIKGSHLAASVFTCDQCGANFKWCMQLHRHRRRFHGDSVDLHGSNDQMPTDSQW